MVEELCEWVALIDDINAAVRASRDGNHAEVVARVAKAVNAEYDLTLDCAHLGAIADDLGIGDEE